MQIFSSLRDKLVLKLFFLFLLTGCGTVKVNVHRNLDDQNYPLSVAILPFSVNKDIAVEKEPHTIFREAFFVNFSYLAYTDMPLQEVDKKLLAAGITLLDKKALYLQLKETLGVDAVIMGHVSDATNFTSGIHAQTTITAKLEMIDLSDGTSVWDVELTEMTYAGIGSPTIVDIIKDQIDNANVQQAYYRLAESISIKIINEIPDPVTLRKFNIQQQQISPAEYTGSYRIAKEDKIDNALKIGTLENKLDAHSKKISKPTTIDKSDIE